MSATEVSVKGAKTVVHVPGAPGQPVAGHTLGHLHPTQAWRIFTPLEEP